MLMLMAMLCSTAGCFEQRGEVMAARHASKDQLKCCAVQCLSASHDVMQCLTSTIVVTSTGRRRKSSDAGSVTQLSEARSLLESQSSRRHSTNAQCCRRDKKTPEALQSTWQMTTRYLSSKLQRQCHSTAALLVNAGDISHGAASSRGPSLPA